MHYPPPVHGAAMVGSYIKASPKVNDTFDCRYINLGTSTTVNEIGKGGFQKQLRFLKILCKSVQSIIRFKPDLVYFTLTSNGIGFYKDSLLAILTKLLGANVVYHFHNKGIKERQDRWVDNLLYTLVFKNAEIILLSDHLYSDVQKYVSRERVHICPNGIPKLILDSKKDIQESENRVVQILFLSNLIESKGVYVLLKACKILKAKDVNFHCTYVGGEGDIQGEELQQSIKNMGLISEVEYIGKRYGKDKHQILLNSDIFVFPTYYQKETFGLVNLEAMQFSLPVISTNEGGIPDVVENGKTGFLVPQQDSAALAEKMEFLINNPDRRKEMGELGRNKFVEEFSLEKFENRFISILRDITSKNNSKLLN